MCVAAALVAGLEQSNARNRPRGRAAFLVACNKMCLAAAVAACILRRRRCYDFRRSFFRQRLALSRIGSPLRKQRVRPSCGTNACMPARCDRRRSEDLLTPLQLQTPLRSLATSLVLLVRSDHVCLIVMSSLFRWVANLPHRARTSRSKSASASLPCRVP